MKIELPAAPRAPRSYLIIDLESAVMDDVGHRRYQAMERWSPGPDDQPARRGYQRHEDPLKTPRWVFQRVVTASVMRLAEHPDGNVEVATFDTFSAPDHDERGVIAGVLQVLHDAPKGTELVSWGGVMHDLPVLLAAVLRHKMTLPHDWRWMAFGGDGRVHHVDFARVLTGGFTMKPIHQAEYAAALDIPAKLTAAPFMVTKLIDQGRWDMVAEICEGDVIILWRLRCGAPWRDVPPKYGSWNTIYRRFRRWSEAGVWEIVAVTLAEIMAETRYDQLASSFLGMVHLATARYWLKFVHAA